MKEEVNMNENHCSVGLQGSALARQTGEEESIIFISRQKALSATMDVTQNSCQLVNELEWLTGDIFALAMLCRRFFPRSADDYYY